MVNLHLPAMPVDQPDQVSGQVHAIGEQDQIHLFPVAIGRPDSHPPHLWNLQTAVSPPSEFDDGVFSDPSSLIRSLQGAMLDDLSNQTSPQTGDEIAMVAHDVFQEFEGQEAAVEDIEAVGLQVSAEFPVFLGCPGRQGDLMRDSLENIELRVEADTALAGATLFSGTIILVEQSPGDPWSNGKEGPVDGQETLGQIIEPGVMRAESDSFPQIADQRDHVLGIEESLGIRERALGYPGAAETLTDTRVIKKLADTAKPSKGRVEKRQQMGDDHVIIEQAAIGMSLPLVKTVEVMIENADVPAANHCVRGFGTEQLGNRSSTSASHAHSRTHCALGRKLGFC